MTASPNHRILYEQNDFPAFQNRMYPTRDDARTCPRADLRIVEDLETGLVYNAAFRPEIMNYDAFYQNDQSTSTIFQAHLNDVAGIVRRTLGLTSLVEVGCGKGMFLDLLTALGADIVGFDPTYEGSDPRIRREYFTQGIGIAGEGIILRHVLEHIPDPVSFLFDIAEANGNRGRIYIEVPCFDWICENHVWYDIFHEHVNYFRLGDFHRIFRSVVESGHVFGRACVYRHLDAGTDDHLGRRLERRDPGADVRARWASGRNGHRYQSGQAGPFPGGDWIAGAFAGGDIADT